MPRKPRSTGKFAPAPSTAVAMSPDEGFDVIIEPIDAARTRDFRAVNTTLIELYWQIGEHIGCKITTAEWGEGVVDRLAA